MFKLNRRSFMLSTAALAASSGIAGRAVAQSNASGTIRILMNGGDADLAILDCSFPASRPNTVHLHAGQCGQVAREATVGRLVLSHFYPIAERHDVRAQAGEAFGGAITKARDLLRIEL